MENANVKEARPTGLAERVVGRLAALKMNKAELAIIINLSRPMVSQYLSGKYTSNPATIEKALEKWLAETEPVQAARPGQGETAAQGTGAGMLPEKKQKLMSSDFLGVMSVCQSCQDDMGLGIIVGRSGYGKTYALRTYAKMDRVAYIECDDTMGCKDLLEAIEAGLGMVRASYGSVWKRVNKIRDFLNVNGGYLIIIDEADKLINKYTVAKMEILRGIFDQADVGIVIAGSRSWRATSRRHWRVLRTGWIFIISCMGFRNRSWGSTWKGGISARQPPGSLPSVHSVQGMGVSGCWTGR